jgi:hypothetical protein
MLLTFDNIQRVAGVAGEQRWQTLMENGLQCIAIRMSFVFRRKASVPPSLY